VVAGQARARAKEIPKRGEALIIAILVHAVVAIRVGRPCCWFTNLYVTHRNIGTGLGVLSQ
jgi:hypothetical protein